METDGLVVDGLGHPGGRPPVIVGRGGVGRTTPELYDFHGPPSCTHSLTQVEAPTGRDVPPTSETTRRDITFGPTEERSPQTHSDTNSRTGRRLESDVARRTTLDISGKDHHSFDGSTKGGDGP